MRVGVVGINHKQASVQLREKLAQTCDKWFGSSRSHETFILLSTCNRIEIYFTSDNLADTHINILHVIREEVDESFDQKMYSFFGEDCFFHLSAVTAGLDSAIIWETEIQGQVKSAYERCKSLPYELHYLFQKSLKNGKLLRKRYEGIRGIPDIEHAVLEIGTKATHPTPSILFVGASAINLKILTHLKKKGLNRITLCNRTDSRTAHYANRHHIQSLPWSELHTFHQFDWVIFGTKSPTPLITADDCPSSKNQLILDLSVPRNVNPQVGDLSHITLLNIDEIHRLLEGRRQRIVHLAREAEHVLEQVIKRQLHSFRRKTKITSISWCASA